MPYKVVDRAAELSTSEGVGPFVLLGGVAGFRSFGSALALADTCPYFIEALDADNVPSGAYEYGRGTYSALNTLTRTTVLGSSNGGAAVNFAAGNKLVSVGVLAADMLAKGDAAALTAFALTLLDDATAAGARTTLGAGALGDALFLTTTAAAARAVMGAAGYGSVRGLVGAVNAATPLTKYDLQALAVTLRDASGALVTQLNTATLTCNLGLAGSAANGRDQAGVFAANSWVYLYFIWDGATLATLASTTAPTAFTGATLPAGYTHWAFATALRWNASSNVIRCFTRGCQVYYDLDDAGVGRVLSAGVSTAFVAISLAGFVPPNALLTHLKTAVDIVGTVLGPYILNLRPTGSASTTGRTAVMGSLQVSGQSADGVGMLYMPPGTSQQIDYKLSFAPSTSGGAYVDVLGYTIPNGDA